MSLVTSVESVVTVATGVESVELGRLEDEVDHMVEVEDHREDVGDEVAREKASQALRDAVSAQANISAQKQGINQGLNQTNNTSFSHQDRRRAFSAPPSTIAPTSSYEECHRNEYRRSFDSSPSHEHTIHAGYQAHSSSRHCYDPDSYSPRRTSDSSIVSSAA